MRVGHRWLRIAALSLPLSVSLPLSAQLNTDRMMSVGRTALYYDDYVLSIQYFNQVINAKPYLYEPYFYRAVAKLSLEDYRGAEQDCNSSISRNPFVVNSYQVRGLSLIYQNRYGEAERDFRKGLSLDPENLSLRHNLILCLARQDESDEALKASDTLLSISPKYTPAMAMKSNLLWERNDSIGAMEWIDKAIGIDRYDAGLYQDRGLLLARMERYSEAEPDMDRAIYLDPANAGIYINRAMVHPGDASWAGGGGNNHHAVVKFKGKYYILYHTRTLKAAMRQSNDWKSRSGFQGYDTTALIRFSRQG